MHDSLKRLPAINSSSSLSKGVLCELYLLYDIHIIACFCSLFILVSILQPHVSIPQLRCDINSEEYVIFRMYTGTQCFNLERIPHILHNLLAIKF